MAFDATKSAATRIGKTREGVHLARRLVFEMKQRERGSGAVVRVPTDEDAMGCAAHASVFEDGAGGLDQASLPIVLSAAGPVAGSMCTTTSGLQARKACSALRVRRSLW